MLSPGSRLHRGLKWAFLAATVIIWAAALASHSWRVEFRSGRWYVGLVEFGINYGHFSSAAKQEGPPGFTVDRQSGFDMSRVNISGPDWWFSTIELTWFALALPPMTGLLWGPDVARYIRRRQPRPGFCARCDYDLAGNTTGACPECGAPYAPTR